MRVVLHQWRLDGCTTLYCECYLLPPVTANRHQLLGLLTPNINVNCLYWTGIGWLGPTGVLESSDSDFHLQHCSALMKCLLLMICNIIEMELYKFLIMCTATTTFILSCERRVFDTFQTRLISNSVEKARLMF